MTKGSIGVVRDHLQYYADRGVFRGFSEPRNGNFKFTWLVNHQVELAVDTTKHTLKFRRLLSGVSPNSAMYRDLKRFIHDRHDRDLPLHRRIDRKRAEASCANRGGFVSVSLNVKNNHYAYGVKCIVNLVHEVFLHLREVHPDYLAENFDVPQE